MCDGEFKSTCRLLLLEPQYESRGEAIKAPAAVQYCCAVRTPRRDSAAAAVCTVWLLLLLLLIVLNAPTPAIVAAPIRQLHSQPQKQSLSSQPVPPLPKHVGTRCNGARFGGAAQCSGGASPPPLPRRRRCTRHNAAALSAPLAPSHSIDEICPLSRTLPK